MLGIFNLVRTALRPGLAATLICTGVLSTGMPASAEGTIQFNFLPSDHNCMDTIHVEDPQLKIMKIKCSSLVVASNSGESCLKSRGSLAFARQAVCWTRKTLPAFPTFTRAFTDPEKRMAVSCLTNGRSATFDGRRITCITTPTKIARIADSLKEIPGVEVGPPVQKECPPDCLLPTRDHGRLPVQHETREQHDQGSGDRK